MRNKIKVDPTKVIKVSPKMLKSNFEKSILDAFTVKANKGRLIIPELEDITISEAKYLIDYAIKLGDYLKQ